MEKAKGNGLSECYLCKKKKYSLNWTSFMYKTSKDNFKHLYCYEHCKQIEEGIVNE